MGAWSDGPGYTTTLMACVGHVSTLHNEGAMKYSPDYFRHSRKPYFSINSGKLFVISEKILIFALEHCHEGLSGGRRCDFREKERSVMLILYLET